MQFKSVFLGRRSIRRYKDKEIPMEVVADIIDIARYSPSSGNLQNWKVIVVDEQDKRQEIADACLQQDWMIEAPVHLVICNDYEDVKNHYGKMGKMYSIQNCSNFALGLSLIAYDKGLGSCWVGAFDHEAIHRILDIPDNMDPEIILTLGYSDETKLSSLREDPQSLTFFNGWGNPFVKFPSHVKRLQQRLKQVKGKLKRLNK